MLDFPYIHMKQRQNLVFCWPHVGRVCFSFLRTYRRLNQLETCPVGKLVQIHQNSSNSLIEQLYVGAFFQAYFTTKVPNLSQERQFRSDIVENVLLTEEKKFFSL